MLQFAARYDIIFKLHSSKKDGGVKTYLENIDIDRIHFNHDVYETICDRGLGREDSTCLVWCCFLYFRVVSIPSIHVNRKVSEYFTFS